MGGEKRMHGFSPSAVPAAPAGRAAELPESVDQQAWAFAETAQIGSYNQIQEGGGTPILSAQ